MTSRYSLLVLTLPILLAFSLTGWSQQAAIPNAPEPKIAVQPTVPVPTVPVSVTVPVTVPDRFLSSQNLMTFTASATAIGGEAVMSCSQQTSGVPLPTKTCEEIYIGAGATLSVEVLAAWAFHRTDHHSMEHAAPFFGMVFHLSRMVWISTHRK